MKIAVIGSRDLLVDISAYISPEDEIVSGGARGVDSCAADYARRHGNKLTEFLPDYNSFGRKAPLIRNKEIVNYADKVLAFWDGESHGTWFVIDYAKKVGKPCHVVLVKRKQSL